MNKGTQMKQARSLVLVLVAATAAALALQAQAGGDHGAHKPAPQAVAQVAAPAAAPAADMTDGEVRKVDKDAAKLTVKHSDIKSLDMPAMTMVFNVRDKAVLEKVKAGDKVKFKATNDGGKFTITDIQVVQ
jgi:Cu(I)/Ag(I) efflux system protein CusF